MHTYLHSYIHIYIHTYLHSYIHIYIHTYLHTYLLTYIYIERERNHIISPFLSSPSQRCMLRIFKHYIFDVSSLPVAASTVSFSSRPGDLESKDDFFLMSSGLVSVETSLTIFNTSLYAALTPKSVPVWIRVQLANRMAADARTWVDLFSRYNSGTHNNVRRNVFFNFRSQLFITCPFFPPFSFNS